MGRGGEAVEESGVGYGNGEVSACSLYIQYLYAHHALPLIQFKHVQIRLHEGKLHEPTRHRSVLAVHQVPRLA